jgi:dihydroneopterin aldolase
LQQGIRFIIKIDDRLFDFTFGIQPHDLEVMQNVVIDLPVFYPNQ